MNNFDKAKTSDEQVEKPAELTNKPDAPHIANSPHQRLLDAFKHSELESPEEGAAVEAGKKLNLMVKNFSEMVANASKESHLIIQVIKMVKHELYRRNNFAEGPSDEIDLTVFERLGDFRTNISDRIFIGDKGQISLIIKGEKGTKCWTGNEVIAAMKLLEDRKVQLRRELISAYRDARSLYEETRRNSEEANVNSQENSDIIAAARKILNGDSHDKILWRLGMDDSHGRPPLVHEN